MEVNEAYMALILAHGFMGSFLEAHGRIPSDSEVDEMVDKSISAAEKLANAIAFRHMKRSSEQADAQKRDS